MEKVLSLHTDYPLSGKIGSLVGMPNDEELALWKKRAGMGMSVANGLTDENNDTMFANAENAEKRGRSRYLSFYLIFLFCSCYGIFIFCKQCLSLIVSFF